MANNSIQEESLDHPPPLLDMIADNSIHEALLDHPTVLTGKPPIRLRRCRPSLPTDPHQNPTESLIPPPPPPGIVGRLVFLLFFYLLVGVIIFYLVMDQMSGTRTNRVLDALYLVVVTMTSVGCGDLVPNSDTTKLLACAFVFTGMAIVGTYISKLADHLVDKQEVFFEATETEASMLSLFDTSRIKYKLYMFSLLLGVDVIAGTVFLWKVENLSLVDSFYCLFYGDKNFPSKLGRVFVIFWIITSTFVTARFFQYLAEFHTERRQKAMAKWLLNRRLTTNDLEKADVDGDRQVGAAEFVLYKLKELGKISQEEVSFLIKEFEKQSVRPPVWEVNDVRH